MLSCGAGCGPAAEPAAARCACRRRRDDLEMAELLLDSPDCRAIGEARRSAAQTTAGREDWASCRDERHVSCLSISSARHDCMCAAETLGQRCHMETCLVSWSCLYRLSTATRSLPRQTSLPRSAVLLRYPSRLCHSRKYTNHR